ININDLFSEKIDIIIPVPVSLISFLKRGFNLVDELFKEFAIKNKIPYIKVLGKRITSKEQKKLSKEERIQLVKKKFYIKKNIDLSNKNILIVDDVFTTGSTINACYELVKKLGANKIFSLTLCRAIENI
ncbi:MAG: ComF family protein, partial [Brevinematia bacterium]